LRLKRDEYLAQIDVLKSRYFSNVGLMGLDNQAVCAFVLFRSMEGVERAVSAFDSWSITKVFFSIFTCCISEKRKSKLFKNNWLTVKHSVEPELLIWENFGVTVWSRMIRMLLYIVFVLMMLVVCFYIILFLEQASNNASSEIPDI
jgi:hypothetical protein